MKIFTWKSLSLGVVVSLLSPVALGLNNLCQANTMFKVGAGVFDITGPAAERGMMGYGMIWQQTSGIAQRLWARAFVIESPCNGKRIVFVNTDLGQVFQGIKQKVVHKLQAKYGNLYADENVLITAVHTHSGPGGFSTYAFYNLTTLGFDRKNFDTIVDGIVAAIERAQNNLTEAQIKFAQGQVIDIGFNRSPQAYLQNPANERARYQDNKDTEMSLLRIEKERGGSIGMINWYPLHGVSMNNQNRLINGDNKGYAEYLFEKDFHSDYGPKAFVAAFAQANAGDISPNPVGHQGGSGEAGLLTTELAGRPQYETAKKLFNHASELVTGEIDYRHVYIAMDKVTIDPQYTNGEQQMTCPAAIGISMLAGTQDGEGVGKQGITCDTISNIIPRFFCEMDRTVCQGVKPIALQTGLMKPYPWTPNILPLQMIRIGNVVIVAAPFELTTMTGRRIKEAVAEQFPKSEKVHIVLSTLANAYSGYVATYEEYQIQRYEGASTHFGPWTEAALRQEYAKLAKALVEGKLVNSGLTPLDLTQHQLDFQPGVIFDAAPRGQSFGSVYHDAKPAYQPGDTVEVSFWGAHPKNSYRIQSTFLAVQRFENGKWVTMRQDRDWDTEYHWQRSGVASSLVTIVWRIPKDTPHGKYRIVHYGNAKAFFKGQISAYQGISSAFNVS